MTLMVLVQHRLLRLLLLLQEKSFYVFKKTYHCLYYVTVSPPVCQVLVNDNFLAFYFIQYVWQTGIHVHENVSSAVFHTYDMCSSAYFLTCLCSTQCRQADFLFTTLAASLILRLVSFTFPTVVHRSRAV